MSATRGEITKLYQRLDQKILQIVFKSVGPDECKRRVIAPASYLTTKALGVTSPGFWDVTEPRDHTWKSGKVQT